MGFLLSADHKLNLSFLELFSKILGIDGNTKVQFCISIIQHCFSKAHEMRTKRESRRDTGCTTRELEFHHNSPWLFRESKSEQHLLKVHEFLDF